MLSLFVLSLFFAARLQEITVRRGTVIVVFSYLKCCFKWGDLGLYGVGEQIQTVMHAYIELTLFCYKERVWIQYTGVFLLEIVTLSLYRWVTKWCRKIGKSYLELIYKGFLIGISLSQITMRLGEVFSDNFGLLFELRGMDIYMSSSIQDSML